MNIARSDFYGPAAIQNGRHFDLIEAIVPPRHDCAVTLHDEAVEIASRDLRDGIAGPLQIVGEVIANVPPRQNAAQLPAGCTGANLQFSRDNEPTEQKWQNRLSHALK